MRRHFENQMSYTSQSFNKQPPPSYFDREDYPEEGAAYPFDLEQLKLLIQGEVFNSLLTIKDQIETKIKQIDRQIRELKDSIGLIKKEGSHAKIMELEERQQEIAQKIKHLIANNERLPIARHDSRKSIDRASYLNQSRERQNSKDRKPIFSKPQNNLSTVLFPFSRNQDPPEPLREDTSSFSFKNQNNHIVSEITQTIQQLNSLIINDIHEESSPFDLPLNMSPISSAPAVVESVVIPPIPFVQRSTGYEQPLMQGLIKNKNKFLMRKSSEEVKQSTKDAGHYKFGVIEEEAVEESMVQK